MAVARIGCGGVSKATHLSCSARHTLCSGQSPQVAQLPALALALDNTSLSPPLSLGTLVVYSPISLSVRLDYHSVSECASYGFIAKRCVAAVAGSGGAMCGAG